MKKRYRFTLIPVLTIEEEAENLQDAEGQAYFNGLSEWNWDATNDEFVQQQNPDGSWGPVMEDA